METEDKTKKIVSGVPNVQTLTEDMVKVLEDDKSGLIKKIIREQEASEKEKINTSPESKKNKLFFTISWMLIILAFGILLFFFLQKEPKTLPNVVDTNTGIFHLIFTDKVELPEVKGLQKNQIIEKTLTQVENVELRQGGVVGVYLTEDGKIIGLRRFIEIIKGNFVAPQEALVSDSFLMGAVNGDSKEFFVLLKMRSFVDIFESLRLWESKMFFDLHDFMGIELNSLTEYLLTKGFENDVLENKNARSLYNEEGELVLAYVFADEQTVVISNSQDAIREVIRRLSSSNIRQ